MSTETSVPQAQCAVCKEWFPLTSEFWHKEKRKLTGFVSTCKGCANSKARERYNPEQASIKAHRRYMTHRDEVKLKVKLYAQTNAEVIKKRRHDYYEANKETHAQRSKAWYAAHPEKSAEIKKAYVERNPERRKQSANEYQRSHKGRAASLRRRARECALPDTFTPDEWMFCLDYWHGCCAYCGSQQDFWNVITSDHYIPLADIAHCPGTVRWNMIPACKHCNSSKQDRDPHEWLLSRFTPKQAADIENRIAIYFAVVSERTAI